MRFRHSCCSTTAPSELELPQRLKSRGMGGCVGFKAAVFALSVLLSFSCLPPSLTGAAAWGGIGRNGNGLAFQKSVVNQGDERLFNKVFAKLRSGQCLDVTAVGGSVTCGVSLRDFRSCEHPDGARNNRTNAWPALLQLLLDNNFPCPGGHSVINVCTGGAGSDSWVDYFRGEGRYAPRLGGTSLYGKDLVIIDTAMNDVEEVGRNARSKGMDALSAIQKLTEQLMVLFLHNISNSNSTSASDSTSLYNNVPSSAATPAVTWRWSGIACLWLGTSSRGVWNGEWPRAGDSVHTHLPVAQHHGVPYISMPDGFGPFYTHESQQWFLNVYRGDFCCHVSIQGHMLLAELLSDYLQTRFADWTQRDLNRPWPYGGSNKNWTYELRRPLLHSYWEVVQLTGSSPLRMDMAGGQPYRPINTTLAPCTGFNFSDDGHNKPGLLAYEAGSTCSFWVTNTALKLHAKFWKLHIKTLKSYNLMGQLDVQVAAVGCDITNGFMDREPLGSMLVDCLWQKHYSLSHVDSIDLKRPTTPTACMMVAVTVVPGKNATHNKIKIFELELF